MTTSRVGLAVGHVDDVYEPWPVGAHHDEVVLAFEEAGAWVHLVVLGYDDLPYPAGDAPVAPGRSAHASLTTQPGAGGGGLIEVGLADLDGDGKRDIAVALFDPVHSGGRVVVECSEVAVDGAGVRPLEPRAIDVGHGDESLPKRTSR